MISPLSSVFPTSAPNLSIAGPSQLIAGPSKLSKGKQRARACQFSDDDESDDQGPEANYDVLDVTSQGENSSDGEEWDRYHERFLEDDIFSPDDPIGLHERYGFNPKVEFHLHIACAPYEGVTLEDLWSPHKTKPLFGGFPKLQPYKAPRLSRPDTIMRQLIALGVEAQQAKKRWDFYNQKNPRLSPELLKWSKQEASVFLRNIQPLIQLLLNRLMSWLRAKAMAPYVFAHWTSMAYILCDALHLFATSERLIDADDFPDSEFTPEDITNQVKKSKIQIVELSYICSELKDWYLLSADIMEKHRGSWLIRSIPPLGEIIEIVDRIVDWLHVTYEMSAAHAEAWLKKWVELLDTPFQRPKKGTNYLFGCAVTAEEPDGLQDALEAARNMDPNLLVMEQVVKSMDEILSGVTDTSLGSKQAPASPVTITTTTKTSQIAHPSSTSEPFPAVKSVLSPPIAPISEDSAQGEQGMDLEAPTLADCAPSTSTLPSAPTASPEPKPRRLRPKMKSKPNATSPQPQTAESAPAIDPITVPSIDESNSRSSTPSAPLDTASGVKCMDVDPPEDGAVIARTSTSPTLNDPPAPALEPSPKSKGKAKAKAKVTSPPPPATVPETRQLRKRKSAPDAETEND